MQPKRFYFVVGEILWIALELTIFIHKNSSHTLLAKSSNSMKGKEKVYSLLAILQELKSHLSVNQLAVQTNGTD